MATGQQWAAELALATKAAGLAAELLRDNYSDEPRVTSNAGRDIKTVADLASEDLIKGHLQESGIAILAEETSATSNPLASDAYWIVDPLDGTFNFVRGLPLCAVSIGLWAHNSPVLGVVLDVAQRICFQGIVGKGAWRNGASTTVSNTSCVDQAALATGFPTYGSFSQAAINRFAYRARLFKKTRLLGSAALSLAYVASGAIDAYHEDGIMLWDVAAGAALVEAAGGKCSILRRPNTYACTAIATNGALPPSAMFPDKN